MVSHFGLLGNKEMDHITRNSESTHYNDIAVPARDIDDIIDQNIKAIRNQVGQIRQTTYCGLSNKIRKYVTWIENGSNTSV